MKKIFRIIKTWQTFTQEERKLVFLCCFWLLTAKIKRLFSPFRNLAQALGAENLKVDIEPNESEKETIKQIKRIFKIVLHNLPISCNCLVQACAMGQILKHYRISYTIYFGVKADDNASLAAHAWLQCGSFPMVGSEIKNEFKIINTFGARF